MSALHKVHITIPLPKNWLYDRAVFQSMIMFKGPEFDHEAAQVIVNQFVAERWEDEWEAEWKDIVADAFLASRNELLHEGRDLHLLNYYDNTDPLKDHSGSITYTFSDRDTALMFKLAYTGD